MSQPWDYIAKLVCIGDSGTGKSSVMLPCFLTSHIPSISPSSDCSLPSLKLTIRLCEGRFSSAHDVTIGVEFGSRIVPVGPPAHPSSPSSPVASSPSRGRPEASSASASPQKHIKLSLWDTAGQETYKSVTRSYFRGASGALLVYDITRRSTFLAVTDWLADLRQIAEPDIVVVLVGNKSDLLDDDADAGGGGEVTGDPADSESKATRSKRQVSRQEAEQWCTANNILTHVETSAKSGAGVEAAFLEVAQRIWVNIEAGRYDLNDRRSGVKGAGAGAGGGGGGIGKRARTVTLGMNDVAATKGGCC